MNTKKGPSGGHTARRHRPKQPAAVRTQPMEQLRQSVSEDTSDDSACAVCLNKMSVFAVGRCNHPVCGDCSVRNRLLCGRKECMICRQEMAKVMHLSSRQSFEAVEHSICPMDRLSGVCFENAQVREHYDKLLLNVCRICAEAQTSQDSQPAECVFSTFSLLDRHMRKVHDLFYCELCTNHLNMFSHERKLYSRKALNQHHKTGDSDDTSYKGHPLCQFCSQRYFDNDDLFMHLRQKHFHCHLCEGVHMYYGNYEELIQHFRAKHYLCEEGECVHERFTNVYGNELDYKAHRMDQHSDQLNKQAIRVNRSVDIDLFYSRRRDPGDDPPSKPKNHQRAAHHSMSQPVPPPPQHQPALPPDLTHDFPSLDPGAQAPSDQTTALASGSSSSNFARKVALGSGQNWSSGGGSSWIDDHQDFPRLQGSRTGAVVTAPAAYVSSARPPKAKTKPEADPFPAFSAQASAASGGVLANFRPASQASKSAGASAWSQIATVPANSSSRDGKKKKLPASATAPFDADFPSLEGLAAPLQTPSSLSSSGKSSKLEVNKGNAPPAATTGSGGARPKVPPVVSVSSSLDCAAELVMASRNKANRNELAPSATRVQEAPDVMQVQHFPDLGPSASKMDANFMPAHASGRKEAKSKWQKSQPNERRQEESSTASQRHAKFPLHHVYRQPPDSALRNGQLLSTLSSLLGPKSLELSHFKGLASQLLSGKLSCPEFLKKSMELMDISILQTVMPELITLLPDIAGQKELRRAFRQHSGVSDSLKDCPICGQVLSQADVSAHSQSHALDQDFPSLPT